VLTRRTQYELEKARARAHILEGLTIALNNLDAVIQTIRESPDADVAKERLMKRFKLSELQAQAILDMHCAAWPPSNGQKLKMNINSQTTDCHFEDLLAHPKKILALIQDDCVSSPRNMRRAPYNTSPPRPWKNLSESDLVPDEAVLISLTAQGYIKRVAAASFRSQIKVGKV